MEMSIFLLWVYSIVCVAGGKVDRDYINLNRRMTSLENVVQNILMDFGNVREKNSELEYKYRLLSEELHRFRIQREDIAPGDNSDTGGELPAGFDQHLVPITGSLTSQKTRADILGNPGPKGDKGDPGPKGDNGISGFNGDDGLDGEKGDKGEPGGMGPKGSPGISGFNGDDGLDGVDGAKGDIGPAGPKGDTGMSGPKGDNGMPGAKGDNGMPGSEGDNGMPGAKGDNGMPGAKGDNGMPGAKGDKGMPGGRGADGRTGGKGEKGDLGLKGDIGPLGPMGPTGYTGRPGVTGQKGHPGNPGINGPKGDTGSPGIVGPKGATGHYGEKGSTGDRGLIGPKGDKGVKGFKGDIGYKGQTGYPGQKGEPGQTVSGTNPKVVFSAYVTRRITYFNTGSVIVFNGQRVNLGGFYNSVQGTFRCGVAGVYMFTWSIHVQGGQALSTNLVVNGRYNNIGTVFASSPNINYNTGSSTTILHLNIGDTVYVAGFHAPMNSVYIETESSFSGLLLN